MVTEAKVKEKAKDEKEVPPDFGDHPPGAVVVGEGGAMPEYRHGRQEEARPVEHAIGDQPEGVVEDPIVYPPDELPPALEEPPPEGKEKSADKHQAKTEDKSHAKPADTKHPTNHTTHSTTPPGPHTVPPGPTPTQRS